MPCHVFKQVAAASKRGELHADEEVDVVMRMLQNDTPLLLLAQHFGGLPTLATHLRVSCGSQGFALSSDDVISTCLLLLWWRVRVVRRYLAVSSYCGDL